MSKEMFTPYFIIKIPDMLNNNFQKTLRKERGRHAWWKSQIFNVLAKPRETMHGYQEKSCSKMKCLKNWNNFGERCQENRKERVPLYLRQRGITFIRPTIKSGGIVRRKNIGISKGMPPYEKNKQQHGQFRKAMQIHTHYAALLKVYIKPVMLWGKEKLS